MTMIIGKEVHVTVNVSDDTEFECDYFVYDDDYTELFDRIKKEFPGASSAVVVVTF